MTVEKMTKLISKVLFESNEFWTADNSDYGFGFLPDNVIAVNGEEEDGSFIIDVTKIPDEIEKSVLENIKNKQEKEQNANSI